MITTTTTPSHVGHTADGRQFFLTTPFLPKHGHDEGQEFVPLFLFDADGHFLEARIDALGTRAGRWPDRGTTLRRRAVRHNLWLLIRDREDDDEAWWVELHPGNYMAFHEPWDSGEYDT